MRKKFVVLTLCASFLAFCLLPVSGVRAAGAPRHVHLSWQRSPSTTMTVTWHTDTGLSGYTPTVKYGNVSGSYPWSKTGTSSTYSVATVSVHVVELTGLSPSTKYYFTCGSDSYEWSTEYSFTTAFSENKGFRFVAFGDSRNGVWPFESTDNANFEIWQQSVSKAASESPLFSIFTGDNVRDCTDESKWNLWFDKLLPHAGIPFMATAGNHEYSSGNLCDAYLKRFSFPANEDLTLSERAYSFDIAKTHFICLDTGGSDDEPSYLYSQQPWLENDLKSAKQRGCEWIIVFLHRPPYCAGGNHDPANDVQSAWVPLFDDYGVDLVLNGHNHYYERTYPLKGGGESPTVTSADTNDYYNPGGTIYVVAGGAGAPLVDTGSSYYLVSASKSYHYCVLDIIPGKKLEAHVKKLDGTEIDNFSISKATPPTLYSVTPESGSAGEVVKLLGLNFGSDRGSSYVSFGSVKATEYVSWSDTEIKVRVPSGISPGTVYITVTTLEGTSEAVQFEVEKAKPPVISSISPPSAKPGEPVSISGSYFGSDRGSS
ncbi:MAG: fibronectin type III domain-containing protein, partial [Actinomycetota bacterium]|nr:fibronectin type III domain-containing protein [Actinomycetota bacterium]